MKNIQYHFIDITKNYGHHIFYLYRYFSNLQLNYLFIKFRTSIM